MEQHVPHGSDHVAHLGQVVERSEVLLLHHRRRGLGVEDVAGDLLEGVPRGLLLIDPVLELDSLGDDEGVVLGVDYFAKDATYTVDRHGREDHALQLLPRNELYVYHPTLHDGFDSYGYAATTGGLSVWLRIDQLPSDTAEVLGGFFDVSVNPYGELSLSVRDSEVATVGTVTEGEWFHLVLTGVSEPYTMNFDVWLNGEVAGAVPVWTHNGWLTDRHEFTVGGADTYVTVDQVSVLEDVPSAVNVQQLANQGSF